MKPYGTSKYRAKKVTIDGITFDSKKEACRWMQLKVFESEGKISNLRRQVEYILIPAQHDHKGKVIERSVKYYADFEYWDNDMDLKVVEDTKGMRTDAYIIKRKLMLWLHGIRITEV